MTELAIRGGDPVRTRPFEAYNPIGEAERDAVLAVLERGQLSGFLGTSSPEFRGGAEVRELESAWSDAFGMTHAVAVNSATSGLYAAVAASGVGPGDEVIVTPFSMSASATGPLVYGAVPVFADIDPDSYCLSAESIRARLTPRTRAIVVVDLFGHPAALPEIMALARAHELVVIEDAAQAPGATLGGRYAGTLADIGVFSLNRHKTIHCGEGGVVVTDDDRFAERVRLVRNHGEVVVHARGSDDLVNMIGFNYRMTEIEAAIARQQLKKLPGLVDDRNAVADRLSKGLAGLPGLTGPVVPSDVRHGWYFYAMQWDAESTGVPRERFVEAVEAEGIPFFQGYTEPLYLQALYQRRIAIGSGGFPFTTHGVASDVDYSRGICPVAERMYERELVYTNVCRSGLDEADVDDVVRGITKVAEQLDALR